MSIDENQKTVFKRIFNSLILESIETSKSKGWEKGNDGEALMLIVSELAEALEWLRDKDPESDHIAPFSGVEEELADVIIRIFGFAGHRDLDVAGALFAKLEFNKTREYQHGGRGF